MIRHFQLTVTTSASSAQLQLATRIRGTMRAHARVAIPRVDACGNRVTCVQRRRGALVDELLAYTTGESGVGRHVREAGLALTSLSAEDVGAHGVW